MKRKSFRVFSPQFPYPATEGSFHVISQQLIYFCKHYDTELVIWKDEAKVVEEKLAERDRFGIPQNLKVTVLRHQEKYPEPQAHRFVRVLKSLASDIASPELYYYPELFEELDALPPADINLFHYSFCYPWLKRWIGQNKGRNVVYFHNLESDLFSSRSSSEKHWVFRVIHRANMEKLLAHEVAISSLADEIWFISKKDLEIYSRRALAVRSILRVAPPTYDEKLFFERQQEFIANRPKSSKALVGFVGGLYFEPNQKSILWILDNVAPILQAQNFSGQIWIVGRGAPDWLIQRLSKYSFVKFDGYVKDLTEFWSSLSLMMVPHITGSGVRIKLLESIASGIPTLANLAAVERAHPGLMNCKLLTISDDPKVWAKHILSISGSELRMKHTNLGLDPSLSAEAVFHFLNDLN